MLLLSFSFLVCLLLLKFIHLGLVPVHLLRLSLETKLLFATATLNTDVLGFAGALRTNTHGATWIELRWYLQLDSHSAWDPDVSVETCPGLVLALRGCVVCLNEGTQYCQQSKLGVL